MACQKRLTENLHSGEAQQCFWHNCNHRWLSMSTMSPIIRSSCDVSFVAKIPISVFASRIGVEDDGWISHATQL